MCLAELWGLWSAVSVTGGDKEPAQPLRLALFISCSQGQELWRKQGAVEGASQQFSVPHSLYSIQTEPPSPQSRAGHHAGSVTETKARWWWGNMDVTRGMKRMGGEAVGMKTETTSTSVVFNLWVTTPAAGVGWGVE